MRTLIPYLSVLFVFVLSGCQEKNIETHPEVNNYVENNFKQTLNEMDIKELRCTPNLNGGYDVVYHHELTPNDFPYTVLIIKNEKFYDVFFDESYLKKNKNVLIEDINSCIKKTQELYEAEQSWK